MIIGIDASLRSTGLVAIDDEGNLVDAEIIAASKTFDGEDLLLYQVKQIIRFVERNKKGLVGVAIEGLSFGAVGSRKDLLAGVYWSIRLALRYKFPTLPIGSVPVSAWRSKVLTKEEQKLCRSSGVKDALKKATVDKLPQEVRDIFECYIRSCLMDCFNNVKGTSVYDLTDAYFIAQYRLSLDGEGYAAA